MTSTPPLNRSVEQTDLLETLARHRFFLRFTVRGLSDAQAGLRLTVSELCLGGLIKHVAATEQGWMAFVLGEPGALGQGKAWDPRARARAREFSMLPGETLTGVLAVYDEVAARTEDIIHTLPDLSASRPLPEAPWFEQGARWSARRVLLHIIAETAQHAGHADILRETLDGSKTMG